MISICYLKEFNKMNVGIIKARNLPSHNKVGSSGKVFC